MDTKMRILIIGKWLTDGLLLILSIGLLSLAINFTSFVIYYCSNHNMKAIQWDWNFVLFAY